jgi:hypothetical protein
MYSGYSFKKKVANKNIKNGPIIQVIKNDAVSNFGFSNILGTCEKSILVNGGYIIKISPIAKGILVVPDENELIKPAVLGIKYPIPTPISIAKNIQRVKNRSKKFNFFFIFKTLRYQDSLRFFMCKVVIA